jgi:hypothetical protein
MEKHLINTKLVKPTLLIFGCILTLTIFGYVIGGYFTVPLILFGLITGLNARYVSLKRIIIIAIILSLVVSMASYWQGNIFVVCGMVALASLVSGLSDKWAIGMGRLIPVAVVIVGSVPHAQSAVSLGVWSLYGCLAGVGLIFLAKIHQTPKHATYLQIKINTFALVLIASLFTYIILKFNLPHGYWAVLTLCSVLKPGIDETIQVVRERIVGTIVGALGGLILVTILPKSIAIIGVVVCMALMIYYMLKAEYRYYVVFMTIMLVLLMAKGATSQAFHIGEERVLLTFSSAIITAIVALALWYLQKYISSTNKQLSQIDN